MKLFEPWVAREVNWKVPAFILACWVAVVWLPAPWVVLCLWVPVCEEVIFRAGVQEALLRRGMRPRWANAVTVSAFVVLHGVCRSWALAPWVALPAWFLGWVYQRYRTQGGPALQQCVLWHVGFNVFYVLCLQPLEGVVWPGW